MVFSGNTPTSTTGGPQNGQGVSNVDDVLGVPIITIGATTLTTSVQTPALTNIDSYHGLPLTAMHFQLVETDTSGNTTTPTVQSVENVLKLFRLQSINGQFGEPLINADGTYLSMSRWQRLKNPYGYYSTGPATVITTTATAVTMTWSFDLYWTLTPELFPLRPTVSINTLASRATTSYSETGTMTSFTVTGDYTRTGIGAKRSRLKMLAFGESATGNPQLASNLDKGVTVLQQAYDYGADGQLTSTNTFNFSLQGQQVFNNKPYQDIINAEYAKFPSATHISGFFPFSVADSRVRYFDNTLNFTSAIGTAPYLNSSTGPNAYTSTMGAYLEEAF